MAMVLDVLELVMQQQIDNLHTEGFIHLKNFFPKNTIESVKNDALRVFSIQGNASQSNGQHSLTAESDIYELFRKHKQRFIGCGKQIQHLPSLHQLGLNPKLIELMHGLGIQFPVISTRPVLFFNSKHLADKETYWKMPPHQDWRSIQGSINSLVAWVPLCDIDRDLGALEIIPKSHLLGLQTNELVDSFGVVNSAYRQDNLFKSMEVEIGDLIIFSQFLIHRSGHNATDAIRWSCHFRYNDLLEPTFIDRFYPHTYQYFPADELLYPEFDTPTFVNEYYTDDNNQY